MSEEIKIAVAGTGYVGLSIATLLAQHHPVTAVDVIPEKVETLNRKQSPIQDEYIEKYLKEKELNLTATLDGASAYRDADFIVIAAPTNYDPVKNYFDTHHIEDVIDLVLSVNPRAVMVIKSTIPVGYCRSLYLRYAQKGIERLNLLFSCVFFGQLLAGLFLHSLFLLQGVPHLPVPGLILSGPLYRGGGSLFMPGLFAVSLLLAGSAWCSHLCYLGVWDARAADAGPRSGRGVPALWRKMRWGLLAVSLLLPLGLRLAGLPWPWALVFALALGLALLPCALWLSRKLGIPVYCCGICPLGMTANLLARLSPWRLRRNGHCTGCGACARVCRYGALRLDGDGRVTGPDWRCTLCRDCMSVCRHRALEIRCCGRGGAWVEQALLCSLSVLHTLFLFMGRV